MKHKVGDKVRIKSLDWYNENKDINGYICGFTLKMSEYCGKTATVVKVGRCHYELDIDDGDWYWTDEMFDENYNENKMESKKVKINLPKNCEVDSMNASIENGFIVVEYIPKKKFVPKDGDIVYLTDKSGISWISIYKCKSNSPLKNSLWDYCSIDIKSKTLTEYPTWIFKEDIKEIRLATEEEKKILFDALENKNLIWNAEEKRLEKIRWRAKHGQPYFFIDYDIEVDKCPEYNRPANDKCFERGNYFQYEEEAQGYADKFKELLKNR